MPRPSRRRWRRGRAWWCDEGGNCEVWVWVLVSLERRKVLYERMNAASALLFCWRPCPLGQEGDCSPSTSRALLRGVLAVAAATLHAEGPSFEVVAALTGGAFGCMTCVVLPVGFHLAMFRRPMRGRWAVLHWTLVGASVVLGALGTAWEFLPRGWMG